MHLQRLLLKTSIRNVVERCSSAQVNLLRKRRAAVLSLAMKRWNASLTTVSHAARIVKNVKVNVLTDAARKNAVRNVADRIRIARRSVQLLNAESVTAKNNP